MDIFDINSYDYYLPENLIAQTPLKNRDTSKMLVFNKSKNFIEHKHFFDLINYLNKGDCLVVNNTKVIPARLMGIKEDTHAKIEVLLLKRMDLKTWEVLLKPAKRAKIGTVISFSDELSLKVVADADFFGGKIVEFSFENNFETLLEQLGSMPLPHYIKEKLKDNSSYQTVYSKVDGSSAAPTAGLHFTPELLEKIKEKGVSVVEVLLHVGLGTFRPVSENNILHHKMHHEYLEITEESAKIINNTKAQGNKVFAVGTTSVRALESSAGENGRVEVCRNETNIFIYPGYKFKVVDALITNFHLPKSTLIMLVSAFSGIKNTIGFYNEAVKNNYRFFSFGDACLII